MTRVEIEYCVPCGMLNRAQDVSEALFKQFGEDLDEVALVTGDDGVFVVRAGDEVVFDKTEDEYDVDAIVRAVRPHVGATA
ncbi:selenoprotein [Halorubrum sp. Ib24]|uniref:SelT/SelW/SelH family protein n=1 Tax=unclassified Halorubrum TaxID=2642239 RepID=UPI000B98F9E6|nr:MULTISPECIES: Rdx family protein [unclassified Halorubrum]OYR38078.1 selenoprotein [Halorubrum sp. Ib24]OYR38787.1 selenoprotein [Halorubrum sp. Eb13]OYR42901.1 selenoprotein [Halorubrum sp. Hd13]OYR49235.1 selenoprotein [Halorubrum sp. Ea1]OYR52430.1 selenoprotein [Halorubrum sp. Ea8]